MSFVDPLFTPNKFLIEATSILTEGVSDVRSLTESLIQDDKSVFWVRDSSGESQLFLSPSYEKVWGRSCESLSQNPGSWSEMLVQEDALRMEAALARRYLDFSSRDAVIQRYRIFLPNGSVRHIEDFCVALFSDSDEHIGFAGIAKQVSVEYWMSLVTPSCVDQQVSDLYSNFLKITKTAISRKSLIEHSLRSDGTRVMLTPREMDCLSGLLQAKSAKQICRLMGISPRTVENHLKNIRKKASCTTSLELMTNILSSTLPVV